MKSIPLKRTRIVSFAVDVREFITQAYDKESVSCLETFLPRFESLRSDVSCIGGYAGIEASLNATKQWLGALELLAGEFGEEGRPIPSFHWNDSLRQQHWEERRSVKWERSCVLHNIGALHSLLGCTADRSTSDGMKSSLKNFQIAAGVFALLRDVVMPEYFDTTTRDLRDPVLSMNVYLLLAQAQTCYYDKAVGGKLARSLLSKLAASIANLYEQAFKEASAAAKGYLEPEIPAWLNLQALCYSAAANYQTALSEKEDVELRSLGYGPLISRLRLCQQLSQDAAEIRDRHSFAANFSELQTKVTELLDELESDNAMIYLEVVPDTSTLPALEMACNVSATPVTVASLYVENEAATQAFRAVTPKWLRADIDIYLKRCAEIQTKLEAKGSQTADTIKDSLTANNAILKYFDVLERNADEEQNPDKLWDKIHAVQTNGGVDALQEAVASLDSNASAARAELDGLSSSLKHYKMDQSKRQFITALDDLQGKRKAAQEANSQISSNLSLTKSFFHYFQKTRAEIEELLPPRSAPLSSPEAKARSSPDRLKLRQALDDVHSSRNALEKRLEDDLKARVSQGIPKLRIQLLQNKHARVEVLSSHVDEWKEYAELSVGTSTSEATTALRALEDLVTELRSTCGGVSGFVAAEDPREAFFKELDAAASALLAAFSESSQGRRFFDALRKHTQALETQIDGWKKTAEFAALGSGEQGQACSSRPAASPVPFEEPQWVLWEYGPGGTNNTILLKLLKDSFF